MPSAGGDADPRLAKSLDAYAGDPTAARRAEVLAAFVDAQVLAALAAVATGHEIARTTGLPAESGAELSLLLLEDGEGARALPVCSDLEALRRWRLDARPIPLTGAQAAAAALEQGAAHVLIDPVGAGVSVGPSELASLAAGWVPVPGSNLASRTGPRPDLRAPAVLPPGLVDALAVPLAGEGLLSARLLEGPNGRLVLGVAARRPLGAPALAALAQRVVHALGDALPGEGLELQQVHPRGPGVTVLRRWRVRR
jgi:hypothetical protein